MNLMREMGSRKVVLRIDVQDNPRHLSPISALGVSIKNPAIYDGVAGEVERAINAAKETD